MNTCSAPVPVLVLGIQRWVWYPALGSSVVWWDRKIPILFCDSGKEEEDTLERVTDSAWGKRILPEREKKDIPSIKNSTQTRHGVKGQGFLIFFPDTVHVESSICTPERSRGCCRWRDETPHTCGPLSALRRSRGWGHSRDECFNGIVLGEWGWKETSQTAKGLEWGC